MTRSTFAMGTFLYCAFCIVIFFFWLPKDLALVGDSRSYSLGAVHLLEMHTYSQDGIHPFSEREPLYSVFIAAVYAVFGLSNVTAVFFVQAILYWLASVLFVRFLERSFGQRVATISFFLLLLSPSVLHAIFILYREAYVLSLLMFLMLLIDAFLRTHRMILAVCIGILLGVIALTYYSFVFLPFFIAAYLLFSRVSWKPILIMLLCPLVMIGAWGMRNRAVDGVFRIAAYDRSAIMWYVRGEQAEKVHGLEPLRCLWSEYISRDWTGRSDACSFNALMHAKWPDGVSRNYASVAPLGLMKIKSHFASYIWFSVVEILELHFPFVGGGWPFVMNLLAAIGSGILYVGCIVAWRSAADRRCILFLVFVFYNTAVFILTDAIPRYMIPVSFCYVPFAAIGYDKVIRYLGSLHSLRR